MKCEVMANCIPWHDEIATYPFCGDLRKMKSTFLSAKMTNMMYGVIQGVFLTGSAPKSSKCWGWQNPNQKSESGPIQKQDVKF